VFQCLIVFKGVVNALLSVCIDMTLKVATNTYSYVYIIILTNSLAQKHAIKGRLYHLEVYFPIFWHRQPVLATNYDSRQRCLGFRFILLISTIILSPSSGAKLILSYRLVLILRLWTSEISELLYKGNENSLYTFRKYGVGSDSE
jgi:hypothetical protein